MSARSAISSSVRTCLRCLNRHAVKIIIVGIFDFDFDDIARFDALGITDQNIPVNFRRICMRTAIGSALIINIIDNDFERAANLGFLTLG